MKKEVVSTAPDFTPVTLQFTCESQAELDFFQCIFDSGAIDSAADSVLGIKLGFFNIPGGSSDKVIEFEEAIDRNVA